MDQILIIDDDVALCELVTEYLEPHAFQIKSVHRGDTGADAYLPKPFNPRELVARIRAILRRSQTARASEHDQPAALTAGDIELDLGTRVVRRAGQVVELTAVE